MQQCMSALQELNQEYMQVTYDLAIAKIALQIQATETKSLIGFHAFTGCDFNPAFFNKGKKRPFTLLKKNVEFQQEFATLGEENLIEDQLNEVFNTIQKFTCQLYNAKKSIDVDDGRYQLFVSNYKPSNVNENFTKKIVNFDASSIPPCKSELYQQLRRAHYISIVWKNAYKKQPTTLDPLDYGWIEQEDKFVFKWFEGDQLPTSVSDLISKIPESDSMDDEDESHNAIHDSDYDDE
ncbi:uncharacterized protein LOC108740487 [Agrilus planipennis]|uniref:Uncharacterized protein LOC108740487 n=1 Tax=Agrilus planipennis TaxID=224129 RepID=A0A7F5RJA3_AGRPL|nr:uncharacterized protein LOC108740487 [Agrilus planipennis]